MTSQRSYMPVGSQTQLRREVLSRGDHEVEALVCDIRRIGQVLESPQTVNHPYVKSAVTQLDKQLAEALGECQGRHRARTGDGTAAVKAARSRTRGAITSSPIR